MIEKKVLDTVFSKITNGGLDVVYWDGDTRHYGPEKPYITIHIKSPDVVRRMMRNTSLGFGECYSEGLIDVDGPLTDVVRLTSLNPLNVHNPLSGLGAIHRKKNTRGRQKTYIAHHYDIGNEFYKLWLDKSMLYTCAYYHKKSDTLEKAQEQKIDYVLKKLRIQKGQSLADLGCGWGELLIAAAKKYGVTGIGVTLSEEQVKHARASAQKAGVDKLIKFELMNYQDLPAHVKGKQFDRVVSVGMMEHVGLHNQANYFKTVDILLKDGGVSLAHFISQQKELPNDAWIDKYIFPGGHLPSVRATVQLLPDYNLRLIDYENLRLHYAYTLHEWRRRYNAHQKEITAMFDDYFYRMWDMWLASSEASFEFGSIDLSQLVFTKGAVNNLPLTREDWYR